MIERLSNVTIGATGTEVKAGSISEGRASTREAFPGHPFGLGIPRDPTPYGYHYG
jgi:hypothetical protein